MMKCKASTQKLDPKWSSIYSIKLDGKCQVPEKLKAKGYMGINQIIPLHHKCSIKDIILAEYVK